MNALEEKQEKKELQSLAEENTMAVISGAIEALEEKQGKEREYISQLAENLVKNVAEQTIDEIQANTEKVANDIISSIISSILNGIDEQEHKDISEKHKNQNDDHLD